MFFFLNILKKIVQILHSNDSPSQVAWGVVLGSFMGLAPFFCLHKLVILLMILLLNVNMGAAFLSVLIFSIVGVLTDPLANLIGYSLLVKTPGLTGMWTSLYNAPVVPFTRFSNTIVLGSLVLNFVFLVPLFVFAKKFIVYYRNNLAQKVEKWKIMKLLKLSAVTRFYSN